MSGTGTYTWELVRQFVERNDLELVVFAQGGWVPADLRSRVEVVPAPRFASAIGRVVYEQTVFAVRVSRHNLDVLWSTGYVVPLAAPVPHVATIHDLYYRHAPDAVAGIRRQYFRWLVPATVRRSRRIVVGAANTAADLTAELGVERTTCVRVVPHGVRTALASVEPIVPEVEAPYVLAVAAATANKRLHVVIGAVERLRAEGHNLRLVVVGTDPYGLLAAAIDGKDDWVVHRERVDEGELAGLYRNAAAYVTASGGALPEVAGFGAHYPPAVDAKSYATSISMVLSEDDVAEALRTAGYRNVERFSWDRAADETAAVIHEAAR
jgi:glycosyltransferase involved in cell wall biosynthesis